MTLQVRLTKLEFDVPGLGGFGVGLEVGGLGEFRD